mgnify:CR=1 FL=1
MLNNGHKVGENLGRMEFVGQAVPYGNTRILGKLLNDLLTVTAVFNTVIHSAKHTRGVGNAFLFADLRSRRVEIGHAHAKVACGNLKGATGTGAGLFKDEGDILAFA